MGTGGLRTECLRLHARGPVMAAALSSDNALHVSSLLQLIAPDGCGSAVTDVPVRFHSVLALRRYFRVALLPSSADVSCLFRTKVHPPTESVLYNDVFRVVISQAALQQKTLRVDLCSVSQHRREECLVGTFAVPLKGHRDPCSAKLFPTYALPTAATA